jgi:hypothetical protein
MTRILAYNFWLLQPPVPTIDVASDIAFIIDSSTAMTPAYLENVTVYSIAYPENMAT